MGEQDRAWTETYSLGSPEAERELHARLADDMAAIQARLARRTGRTGQRTLHAKIIAGIASARLEVDGTFPADLAQGHFQPGAILPAQVRLSNASSLHQADVAPDMRGMAIRLDLGPEGRHDLLATSFPVSHARDAVQFVKVAQIANGPKALILPRFVLAFGVSETLRIIRNVRSGARGSPSIATEQFWSRGAILWGTAGPVRFTLRPEATAAAGTPAPDLGAELASRRAQGPIRYRLCLQRFVDTARTPIEDGAVEWLEALSPMIPIATLVLPVEPDAAVVRAETEAVDQIAFSPWNAPAAFRPLGNLNRARGPVYAASARQWQRDASGQR